MSRLYLNNVIIISIWIVKPGNLALKTRVSSQTVSLNELRSSACRQLKLAQKNKQLCSEIAFVNICCHKRNPTLFFFFSNCRRPLILPVNSCSALFCMPSLSNHRGFSFARYLVGGVFVTAWGERKTGAKRRGRASCGCIPGVGVSLCKETDL